MNFDILATVSVALLSSFSHCYAMCGGFNIAFLRLNSASNDENVGVNSNENSQNLANSNKNSQNTENSSLNSNSQNVRNSSLNSAKSSQNTENFINSKLNSAPSKAYLTNLNSKQETQNSTNSASMSSNLNATNSNSNKNSQHNEDFINSSLNSAPSKAYLTNLNATKISQNNKNSTTSSQHSKTPSIKFTLSLVYHIFRVLAYMLLGVIFGAFGNVLSFLNKGIFFFVLGIFMVLLGLALNFRGQFLAFFENPFFFNLFAKKMWQRLNFKGYKSAIILGFCNGFVPCGLVYFYLALAMSQDSLIQSAFIMLVFGACTLPALLFFNEAFSLLQRAFGDRFQVWWTKISYFIIILYGIYLAYLGVSLTR